MEMCDTCDHNVKIECEGGCFFPHKNPPCFRQAMESQTTAVQQIKAEIRASIDKLRSCYPTKSMQAINIHIDKMIKLSAIG